MKKFNIGDTVYFIQKWTGIIEHGTITKIQTIQHCGESINVATIKTNLGSSQNINMENLYPSYDTAIAARDNKREAIKNQYRAEITDINSLVEFLCTHNVAHAEEYTDWEARAVAQEKIKELLGFEPKL